MRKSTEKISRLLKAAVLALSAVFCLFMPVMTGLGLIYNRSSYGESLAFTGVFFIVSALLMTTGTVLCGSRKKVSNVLSVVLAIMGAILCMAMLRKLCLHADVSGWSDKFTMEQISHMYERRILPCIIPVIMSVIMSLVRISSGKDDKGEYTPIL